MRTSKEKWQSENRRGKRWKLHIAKRKKRNININLGKGNKIMSFTPISLTLWSNAQSPNSPRTLPQWWGYETSTDDIATVSASGYFNTVPNTLLQNTMFRVNDYFYCACSDGLANLYITALEPNVVTAAQPADIPPGSITTSMLGNMIVTAAKIANATITTTQISGTAGILGSQLSATAGIVGTQLTAGTLTTTQLNAAAGILGTQLAANTVASGQLAKTTIQYATVTGITPVTLSTVGASLVAAPGAGNVILPLALNFNYIFATAQYTGGGAIGVQYGSTAAAGGQACSATLAAATLNAYTANEMFGLAPAVSGLTSASINAPLYLTAASANFATGAGTITAFVSYIVVAAS